MSNGNVTTTIITKTEANEVIPLSSQEIEERNDDAKKWLDEEYGKALDEIRNKVTEMWEAAKTKPQIPYFTPHGVEHCRAVESIIHDLIPGKTNYDKLNKEERFCLLASAWLHDIGMISSAYQKFQKNPAIISDDIRNKHHLTSEKYILEYYYEIGLGHRQEYKRAISLLAKYHRRRENIDECPELLPKNIRVRLLAAYLRLADSLHIDSSRSPDYEYAICLMYDIPPESKWHWIKSKLVDGIIIDSKAGVINIYFNVPKDAQLIDRNIKDIKIILDKIDYLIGIIVSELEDELKSVMPVLLGEKITNYININCIRTHGHIEEQHLNDLLSMVGNYDILSNPSASNIVSMILMAIANISGYYLSEDTAPAEVISNITKNTIKENIDRFLKEIDRNLLQKRKCHYGLKNLADKCKKLSNDFLNNDSKEKTDGVKRFIEEIDKLYKDHYKNRESIRKWSANFFMEKHLNNNHNGVSGSPGDPPPNKPNNPKDLKDPNDLNDGNSVLSKDPPDNASNEISSVNGKINILLFGYSKLVITALCGFRDAWIMKKYFNGETRAMYYKNKLYLSDNNKVFEEKFSEVFQIFVCDGQPKTHIEKKVSSYHDGFSYISELIKKNFKDPILIPDILSGNIMREVGINYIMFGANGFDSKFFKHSGGHLSIIELSKSPTILEPKRPKILLVTSKDKYILSEDIFAGKFGGILKGNFDGVFVGSFKDKAMRADFEKNLNKDSISISDLNKDYPKDMEKVRIVGKFENVTVSGNFHNKFEFDFTESIGLGSSAKSFILEGIFNGNFDATYGNAKNEKPGIENKLEGKISATSDNKLEYYTVNSANKATYETCQIICRENLLNLAVEKNEENEENKDKPFNGCKKKCTEDCKKDDAKCKECKECIKECQISIESNDEGFRLWRHPKFDVRDNIWFLKKDEFEKAKEKFFLCNPREDSISTDYLDFIISDIGYYPKDTNDTENKVKFDKFFWDISNNVETEPEF